MTVLMSNAGQGAELRDLLVEALGIPANVRWFDVRFAAGEPVSVRCEFMPTPVDEPEDDDSAPSHTSLDG
ncbi:hypothetical protein [Variovorax saccharolyticus]|uniref:hypothetical protein n=1 Tax=Variovorax saccharolyticus TaxID=3053516 RepID=UPI002578367D|nr:hypothetical protein [Variovorax sp. J31P216]MDM0024079.1 hypothetical protein [Variovorax sp. J31P216]